MNLKQKVKLVIKENYSDLNPIKKYKTKFSNVPSVKSVQLWSKVIPAIIQCARDVGINGYLKI